MSARPEEAKLLDDFESATLSDGSFRHRDHVHVAWLYLRGLPPAAALDRFASGLKRYAAAKGKADLYHETITWAYLLLIRERMERGGADETFEEFAAKNADLLTWKPSILDSYYRKETLSSELARRVFVMPDGSRAGTCGPLLGGHPER